MPQSDDSAREIAQHLKPVSRIKHLILAGYLPPWAEILGSRHRKLYYFDCFAGPGHYEMQGQTVEGSPLIAVEVGKHFASARPANTLLIFLVEENPEQSSRLEDSLKSVPALPDNLGVQICREDSRTIVKFVLETAPPSEPSFFLVDPYGHPLPIPLLNQILDRERSEVMIVLMWYQINRDLSNPVMRKHLDDLFGDTEWQSQEFVRLHGKERELAFLSYFCSRLKAKYAVKFRICYDAVEDKSGGRRTKYYILHASNHIKAALLMKEVMWPLGDEPGTFEYSGGPQRPLISATPAVEDLAKHLTAQFAGRALTFDGIREETWTLPYMEKHYRDVLKRLEGTSVVITRVESKKTGIKGLDRIRFKESQ